MKRTEEDQGFGLRFADALRPFISKDRDVGKSWLKIAKELGVTAAGLQKQLAGSTPSIRTVALAYEKYGISVPYQGVMVAEAVSSKRKRKRRNALENQMLLPFDILVPAASTNLVLKRVPHGVRRYRLQIVIAR